MSIAHFPLFLNISVLTERAKSDIGAHIYGKTERLVVWLMGYALLLSLLAGLFTAVGGAFALLFPPKDSVMAAGMGFAGGVMLTVSLGDLLPEAVETYLAAADTLRAVGMTMSLFCLGILAALLLEGCLPGEEELLAGQRRSCAERKGPKENGEKEKLRATALHGAVVTMAVVMLHNLPEGVLTLFSGFLDRRMGMTVALAIGMHNFPEGLVIAAPVLYATGSRARAFGASVLSGLAEPLGALLSFVFLKRLLNSLFLNGLLCGVAGMMCAVSFRELFALGYRMRPLACTVGALAGCVVMCLGIYCIS